MLNQNEILHLDFIIIDQPNNSSRDRQKFATHNHMKDLLGKLAYIFSF